ncbi:efflux RND transporter periplasmic adaptor subunit [Brasilonema sp. CT11]|nr:efflux RND transporter periplasmic adaptor subunit [Brasilonema sp. CT11]
MMIQSCRLWFFYLFVLSLLAGCSQNLKTPKFFLLASASKDTQIKSQQISEQDAKIPEVPAEAAKPPQGSTYVSLTPQQEQQIGLKVEAVQFKPFPVTIQLTGRVQAAADLLTHIAPPVPGRVTTVFVKLGQRVTRGQTLALIKSDTVGQLQSDLLQATLQTKADIKQAQVQLNFSKAAYQREQKLFNDRISAKADLETARTQYEKDKANLQALYSKFQSAITVAEERLSLSGVSVGVADQVVRTGEIYPYVIVKAAADGIVISRTINTGELADPSKELFTIADLTRVGLVADTYEKDVNNVRIGQPVVLTFDSLPNKTFSGRISYVANVLDPQTRTLTIRADVPNPDLNLKPDMFARFKILVENRSLLSVPKSAIQRKGDYNFAYVKVQEHRYEERRVEVGVDNGESIQVINGLKPGENVVSQGTLALQGAALKLSDGG